MKRLLKSALKWGALLLLAAIVVLVVLILIPIRPTIEPLQPRETTRYWTLSGGYRIAHTRVAAPAGGERPPVLFLHGGPGGYVHSSTIETLSRLTALGRDVYLYDQSGSGLSDRRPPKATTFDSHLDDLHEILTRQIGAAQAVLIGHSYGGELAAHFAAEYPELVERLVLSSPGALPPERFDDDGNWANLADYPVPDELEFIDVADTFVSDTGLRRVPVRAMASIALAFAFDVKLASDEELDAALNTMAAGFTHNMVCDPANVRPEEGGAGAYSRTSANWFPDDFPDRRPQMRAFPAPVLVLQGQCDYIPYAAAYEYADLFPNADYRFVEGAGHIIWWDRPDAYVEAIAEFLAASRSPGAGATDPWRSPSVSGRRPPVRRSGS